VVGSLGARRRLFVLIQQHLTLYQAPDGYSPQTDLLHQKSRSAFRPAAVKPQSGTTGNDAPAVIEK